RRSAGAHPRPAGLWRRLRNAALPGAAAELAQSPRSGALGVAPAVKHRPLPWAVLLLGLGAALLGAQPAWLHAKATLAQLLLERAWAARGADGSTPPPWPGADMRPVARLQLPAQGSDLVVLAGDSGRTLAFGPGWAEASTAPGAAGTVVLSAHRDTHFAVLRAVRPGDPVLLE